MALAPGYYICGVRRTEGMRIPVNDLYTSEPLRFAGLLKQLGNGSHSLQPLLSVDVLLAYGIPTTEGFVPFGVVSNVERAYRISRLEPDGSTVFLTRLHPNQIDFDTIADVEIRKSSPEFSRVFAAARIFEQRMRGYWARQAKVLGHFLEEAGLHTDSIPVLDGLEDGQAVSVREAADKLYAGFVARNQRPVPPQVKVDGIEAIVG